MEPVMVGFGSGKRPARASGGQATGRAVMRVALTGTRPDPVRLDSTAMKRLLYSGQSAVPGWNCDQANQKA
jgi:hypothetical protein